ncbi:hypothetical protein KY284_023853 [Solanum tuberosum]|nr:hypothetical protein KY284_023853 [Solanum tuberosum]
MWELDSGCSRHMCRKKENFKTIKKIDEGFVIFGDNAKGEVTGVGTITLSSSCDLVEVYLVEGLKHNLLSINQLCDVGFQLTFNTTICIINHHDWRSITSDPWLWHQKVGHASMYALEKLSTLELVIGLPKLKLEKDHISDACQLGKQTRSSFKVKDIVSTSKPLQLLPMDLFGPTRTASIGGQRYAFVIVDDFSRKVQREASYFITTIHNDHGGEFENKAFEEFCAQNRFTQNFSSPRSPQQNGVVESKYRSLQDTTRTMLLDRNIPDHFWAEAISTACHILNKCLIRPILKKTPYELWKGKKPKKLLSSFWLAFRVFNKRNLGVEEYVHVVFDDTIPRVQDIEVGDDETASFNQSQAISKVITETNTEELATAEVDSTTPVDKTNIPREWRNNISYLENFILGKPNDKIQTRSSLRKQASLALVSQWNQNE